MTDSSAVSCRALRVGIVGCGAVAELYHLPAVSESPDVQLVAVADTTLARAEGLAARAGSARASTDYRDFYGSVDLAIVCVPNSAHAEVATNLLTAGVHVLVEKPMARSTVECDRMIGAAAASRTLLAVGHDFRYFPVARFAHRLFASGALGEVRRVDVRQGAGSRWPSVSIDVLSSSAGGGVLMTFGVHVLDLLGWWIGDLRPVAYRDDAAGGVEAEAEAEFVLANGAPVWFELSRLRSMRDTFFVECERGTVELGIHEPAMVRLSLAAAEPALVGTVSDLAFEQRPLRAVFRTQLAEVVSAIREGRDPLVPAADGRRAVALVAACYAIRHPLRRAWDYPEAFATVPGGPR